MSDVDIGFRRCSVFNECRIMIGINERVPSFNGECEAVMDEVALSLSGTEDFIVAKITNFGDGNSRAS